MRSACSIKKLNSTIQGNRPPLQQPRPEGARRPEDAACSTHTRNPNSGLTSENLPRPGPSLKPNTNPALTPSPSPLSILNGPSPHPTPPSTHPLSTWTGLHGGWSGPKSTPTQSRTYPPASAHGRPPRRHALVRGQGGLSGGPRSDGLNSAAVV